MKKNLDSKFWQIALIFIIVFYQSMLMIELTSFFENKLLRSKLRSIPDGASLFPNRLHPRSKLRGIQPLENKAHAQEESANLVQNGGFEEIQNGEPVNWSSEPSANSSKTVDSSEKHSGSYSWKFTNLDGAENNWGVAGYSNLIDTSRGDFFTLSAWAKTSSGNEKIKIGIREKILQPDQTYSDAYFYFLDGPAGSLWTQYTKTKAITNAKTRYIQFVIMGPIAIQGSVWFDDIEIIKNEPNYFGCQNTNTAKCLDFGAPGQSYSWIPDAYQNNLDITKIEGNTNYRELIAQKELLIEIPVFNANQDGFPNSDIMFEIRYKDTIDGDTSSSEAKSRPLIYSRINFRSQSINKTWEILDSLESVNDGLWKIAQIPIPQTEWQRLRAIDGKYILDIKMPSDKPDSTLPIDYLSLTSITNQDYQSYLQWLRDRRDLRRVDYSETNPVPNFSGDYTWFIRPLEQQVFPNTIPSASEIEKPIFIVSARDEYEPFVFSLYTKKSLSEVRFEISDFTNSTNNDVISKNNVELNKVVYSDKYWLTYSTGSTYGLMPDHLEKFSSIDISQNSSQQLWFILKVPNTSQGGNYTGNIRIIGPNDFIKTIPVTLDILPFKLDLSEHDNILYHMPYTKVYSTDNNKVFKDIESHNLDGIFSIGSANFTFSYDSNTGLSYDTTLFKQQLDEAITKGVVKRRAYFLNMDAIGRQIAKAIYGESNWTSDLYWQVVETNEFKIAFRQFIHNLINIGLERKLELVFQVIDEPGGYWDRRLSSDRLYRLIRAEGGKTWVTYYEVNDQKLECSTDECQYSPDNIRENGKIYIPPMTDLVDYKVYAAGFIKEANRQTDPDSYAYYTTYYSQARNPVYNRFLHGLFAQKNEVKVVANYAYGDYIGDPYNDFDTLYYRVFPNAYFDYLLAYPTWTSEMLPTLAEEGAREGIKDAKYIATLKRLIAYYPNNPASQEAQNYLDSVLVNISTDWMEDYVNKKDNYGFANKILASVSQTNNETDYAAFADVREKIAGYISQLYKPMLTVTSNKKYTYSSDTLIYTVSFDNATVQSMTNVIITNPIPAKTEYVNDSATNGGVFLNNEITWQVPSLPANQTFTAEFKVRVTQ